MDTIDLGPRGPAGLRVLRQSMATCATYTPLDPALRWLSRCVSFALLLQ